MTSHLVLPLGGATGETVLLNIMRGITASRCRIYAFTAAGAGLVVFIYTNQPLEC